MASAMVPRVIAGDPPDGVVLMSLTRTGSVEFAVNNRFDADSGVYASESFLTAWNSNAQVAIGALNQNVRTPIVINNNAVTASGGLGWRSVGPAPADAGVTVDTATAFQIQFKTAGYDDIRFSCRQKSTGTGPQQFELAYSLDGPTGPFIPIENTRRWNLQGNQLGEGLGPITTTNTYADFDAVETQTFTNFPLPADVADQDVVYLRLYLVDSTLADRTNGNTSINDIIISSGPVEIDYSGGPGIPVIPEDEQLVFSRKAGFYVSQFNLELTTGYEGLPGYENVSIWYTTDGSEPVPGRAETHTVTASDFDNDSITYQWPYGVNSIKYTGPITISNRTNDPNGISMIGNRSFLFGDPERNEEWGGLGRYVAPPHSIFKGNVIRARVFSGDGAPLSGIITKSYVVEDGISSTFAGLPFISLATDAHGLYNPDTGIFTNSDEREADWRERVSHLEFFEPVTDGWELALAQTTGLRIHGGWSRMHPQKSMRQYASSSRDPLNPRFDHDLFAGNALTYDGEPIVEFRRFILRNFGQDGEYAHMRDRLAHSLMNNTNVIGQGSRAAVVMLNGEFWGIYGIRERIDEYFLSSKYKLGSTNVANWTWEWELEQEFPDDFALLREARNWFGNTSINMALPANYAKAQTFVDIDSLIDYFIIQMYTDNRDWPGNNFNMWRYRTDGYPEEGAPLHPKDGRWRYIMRDLDISLAQYQEASVNTNRLTSILNSWYHGFPDDSHWHAMFFRRFCQNPEFVERFINRYFDLINTNLRPSATASLVNKLAAEISEAVPHHRARWLQHSPYWLMLPQLWQDEISKIRTYLNDRPGNMTSHIRNEARFRNLLNGQNGRPDLTTARVCTLTLRTEPARGHLKLNGIGIRPGTAGVTNPVEWSGNYLTGFSQTITAVPVPGYEFSRFIVNGADYRGNPLTFAMTGNTTVVVVFCGCDGDPCKCEPPLPPPRENLPENRGIGFVHMSTASPATPDWGGGFGHVGGPFIEFDVTMDGTYELRVGPWQRSDTMWLNGSTKVHFLSPANPSEPVLPVVIESIAIDGDVKITNQNFSGGHPNSWFWNEVPGTYFGDINLSQRGGYGEEGWTQSISGYTVRGYTVPDINSAAPNGIPISGDTRAGTSALLGPIQAGQYVTVTYKVGAGTAILYGDVDGDGNINSADVTLLRRYIAAEDKKAFLEANGSFCVIRAKVVDEAKPISAADVTLLRRWIASPALNKPILGPQPQ
jgi:hypothetical protein